MATQTSSASSATCSYFKVVSHVISASHVREYPRAMADEAAGPLKLAIKQYIPLSNPNPRPGDITVIAAHAAGFPKEVYEPLFCDLLSFSAAHNFRIRSIWIADAVHQGESGLLNEHNLGNDYSWFDNARDVMHMINHFAPQMPQPLVGLGHCMGAASFTWLSILHPRLFSSLILMEVIIGPDFAYCRGPDFILSSTSRRDLWPNIQAAKRNAQKWWGKTWDPRALECWMSVAYRPLPTVIHPSPSRAAEGANTLPSEMKMANAFDPPVTLKTTIHQELMTYARPNLEEGASQFHKDNMKDTPSQSEEATPRDSHHTTSPKPRGEPFYRPELGMIYSMLPHVRPGTLFIWGSKSPTATPSMRKDKLQRIGTGHGGSGGVAADRVREVVFEGAGHLVPLEKVTDCAKSVAQWIGEENRRWTAEQSTWKRDWDRRTLSQKQTVGSEWMDRLNMLKASKL